ncbi:hypothetical protein [Flavobacterium sp.]|uniref:hypothetical protein n=1 Tax=Flavobacterium sp. TaxID=239 RepID=UPI00375277F1
MNHFSKQDGNKKITILFMVLAFVLLSNVNAFAQKIAVENNIDLNNTLVSSTTSEVSVAKQEAVSNASNMNFVLWFMGSKQDPNAKVLPAGENTKKQFMTSGMAPNRLLIKAFLKKAVNFESATA